MIARILFAFLASLCPMSWAQAEDEIVAPKKNIYNPNSVAPQRGGVSAGLFDDTNPPKDTKDSSPTPTPAHRAPAD